MSFLTAAEAEDLLLSRYGIDASLLPGHVEAASGNLDGGGPYYGSKVSSTQSLAFPRSYTAPGDTANLVPENVKVWVALEAYKLSKADEPGVTSKSVDGIGSKSYARPGVPIEVRLQSGLLNPYIMKAGVLL